MQSVFSTRRNRILLTITLAVCSIALAEDPQSSLQMKSVLGGTYFAAKNPVSSHFHSVKAPRGGTSSIR